MDPLTILILEKEKRKKDHEGFMTAVKKATKCDWKCDRLLKMHEKRAAIAITGIVSLPAAFAAMLLHQIYSKSGILNNLCINKCIQNWVKNKIKNEKDPKKKEKYKKSLVRWKKEGDNWETVIKKRLEKVKKHKKAYDFIKTNYDQIKRM